eukprot:1155635-Pelagomonas_calceolata.AAC.1
MKEAREGGTCNGSSTWSTRRTVHSVQSLMAAALPPPVNPCVRQWLRQLPPPVHPQVRQMDTTAP